MHIWEKKFKGKSEFELSLKKIHLVANFGEKLLIYFFEKSQKECHITDIVKKEIHIYELSFFALSHSFINHAYLKQEKLLPLTLHVPVLILFLKH